MAQAIDKEIIDYLPLLNKSEKKTILDFIKSSMKIKELPERVSIEQYNKEIEDAMARINQGKYTSHEDLMKESETW